MPTIVKELQKRDAEYLHATAEGIFLDGECYAFAIALHHNTGWPIVGLMQGDVIRHAGVRCPDGRLYDVRGPVLEEEFGLPFFVSPPYELRQITEADLYSTREIKQMAIDLASRMAQSLWPDLPWKVDSSQKRVLAFLNDLEEISRRHGIWIRSAVPGSPPLLSHQEGSEGGYVLSPTINALTYTIDRYFRGSE